MKIEMNKQSSILHFFAIIVHIFIEQIFKLLMLKFLISCIFYARSFCLSLYCTILYFKIYLILNKM